jgi:hypothetical protein
MIIRICKSKKKIQTTTYFHKIVFFHEHKVSTVMDNNSININKTVTNVNKKDHDIWRWKSSSLCKELSWPRDPMVGEFTYTCTYISNQCLSQLFYYVMFPLAERCTRYNFIDKVWQHGILDTTLMIRFGNKVYSIQLYW